MEQPPLCTFKKLKILKKTLRLLSSLIRRFFINLKKTIKLNLKEKTKACTPTQHA